eukprot:12565052-Alexandrium_andersonii.AAC.1
MSASLVGSEMCIRDSFRRTLQSSGELRRAPESSGELRKRSGELMRAPETVSYTHLTLPTICSV